MKSCLSLACGLICLLTIFWTQNVEAGGFSNSGRLEMRNVNIFTDGTIDNTGELIGTEAATLVCHTLSGKGLISAPKISITAKIFAYTGTIHCDGKCTIITSSPFNEKMFKRKGKGEFVIIVDENLSKLPKITKSLAHADYELSDQLPVSAE